MTPTPTPVPEPEPELPTTFTPVTIIAYVASGALFIIGILNGTGNASSLPATLTVTSALQGQYYQGPIDYSAALTGGTDNVAYTGTFPITNGQPLNIPFAAGVQNFVVIKYPTSQSAKTNYANPTGGLDNGSIPSIAFQANQFGGNNYAYSRGGNPFTVNNSTGIVTLS